jgi:hypothetical protein
MSNSEPVAIVRQSVTVSITYTSKPDEATRQRLKDAGYKFENGHWYRNQTQGNMATQAEILQLLAAK